MLLWAKMQISPTLPGKKPPVSMWSLKVSMATRGKLTTILLDDNGYKITLMTYCYSHRREPHSTLGEATSCRSRELTQKPTTGQYTERERLGSTRSRMGCLYPTPPTSRLRDLCGRGSRKRIRARGRRWILKRQRVPDAADWGSHELLETLRVWSRPVQIQGRQEFQQGGRGIDKNSHP